MIWGRSATNHLAAISGFSRMWLSWGMLDRLVLVTFLGLMWCMVWGWIGIFSQSISVFLLIFFFIMPLPWGFWILDAILDSNRVSTDIGRFAQDNAILATRCEYLGGHPQLPHGRFAYLLLEGTLQNPNLTLVFPTKEPWPLNADGKATHRAWGERFVLPILDVGKMKTEKGEGDSPAANIATSIHKGAGQFLRSEKLNFVVNYDGEAGRLHKVEFSNFFRGSNEVRNWQNYIVCSQAQAVTGVEPHGPWVSLPNDPTVVSDLLQTTKELEIINGVSGNGHEERKPSSAFERG